MKAAKHLAISDSDTHRSISACSPRLQEIPSSPVERNVKADTMCSDSPGDTSQRCETAPGVFYIDDFRPKITPERSLCLAEQVTLLQSQGLMGEPKDILFHLSKTSLYHLAPYRALLTSSSDKLYDGVNIENLTAAARFDSCLQSILLHYIGTIEIRLRAVLSYHLATERGIFAHIDQATFVDACRMRDMVYRYRKERDRQIRLGNIKAQNYMNRYGELPIWAAVETMSLGTLSMIFQNLKSNYLRKKICASFGVPPKIMQGWLRTLSFTRNECAHFGNLYGKRLIKESARVERLGSYDNRSVFHICAIIQKLLSTGIQAHAQSFPQDLAYTIGAFDIDTSNLGFPNEWKDLLHDLTQTTPGKHLSSGTKWRESFTISNQKPII